MRREWEGELTPKVLKANARDNPVVRDGHLKRQASLLQGKRAACPCDEARVCLPSAQRRERCELKLLMCQEGLDDSRQAHELAQIEEEGVADGLLEAQPVRLQPRGGVRRQGLLLLGRLGAGPCDAGPCGASPCRAGGFGSPMLAAAPEAHRVDHAVAVKPCAYAHAHSRKGCACT